MEINVSGAGGGPARHHPRPGGNALRHRCGGTGEERVTGVCRGG